MPEMRLVKPDEPQITDSDELKRAAINIVAMLPVSLPEAIRTLELAKYLVTDFLGAM